MTKSFQLSISASLLVVALAQTTVGQQLKADLVASGFSRIVAVAQDPTNEHVLFVVEQGGTVWTLVDFVRQQDPFLTLTVDQSSGAAGLLGFEFAPDYAQSRKFYVNYTTPGPRMQLSEFLVSSINPLRADPLSEKHVFSTPNPNGDHFAGTVRFGSDGMLYVPTGDGGGENDPQNRAQNPFDYMGKVFRIDPSGDDFPLDPEKNYRIPFDNPFLDGQPVSALPEIWSIGFRNPWKFSVDKPEWLGTGALVFADVGQDAREEADYEPAGKGGRNYGWKVYEGSRLSNFGQLSYSPHSPPFLEYDHSLGFSITGGPIYRGFELGSTYFGAYFFADWVTKKLWSVLPILDPNGEAVGWSSWTDHTPFVGDLGNIVSIDQGSMGELFVTDYFGKIYRISKTNATWISNVSRSDGAIVQGQARSLIASDDKFLRIDHFSPFYTITKKTGLVVEAKTNMTTPSQVSIEVQAKVNQSVTVPSQVLVWNWTSGLYDLVSTYSLNGTLGNHSVIVTSSDHIDPTSMRIRIKLTTVFSGPLAQPNYGVMYDKVNISSQ